MHKSVKRIFGEHKSPKHCGKADVAGANGPILSLAAKVQLQVAEYRARLMEAENDPALPDAFRGKLEMLHQTLRVVETSAAKYIEDGREITKAFVQWDRYMDDAEADLVKWEAQNGG